MNTKLCLVALAVGVSACSAEPVAPAEHPVALAATANGSTSLPAPTPPPFRMPEGVTPVKIAATLTLVPSQDTYRGQAELSLSVTRPTRLLWLHATALDVSEAHLEIAGGPRRAVRVVPGDKRFVGFAFDEEVPVGPARLSVTYTGHVLTSESQGVFRTQQAGGDQYLTTQFEDVDARRAFPCFDEPSFKIPWQLTLRVRPSDTAISNTPIAEEKLDADGLRTVRFAETKPLPSYLVAFAVGPFEQVDAGKAGKRATAIRLFVPRGRSSEAQYAAAVAPKILPLLEDATGLPYPFEKLDYVVVPGSSTMSSMENAGMILMPTAYSLAKPAELTINQRRNIVQIIAHETAHHWFGNLVTMAWWDDLWLNEGSATWISPRITDQIDPAFDIAVRGTDRLDRAMDLDGLLSARKIRQEINGYDDIANAFDSVTYTKGAAVLSMFESWLGPEEFRKGIHRYVDRFAWKNATSSDFLAAMNESTGKDVTAAFSSFLDHPGVSIVGASLVCDGAAAKLALTQERYLPTGSRGAASFTWQIPVCARYGSGRASGRACTLLAAATGELALPRLDGAKACPDWATIKEAGKGYYRASYPARETGVLLDPKKAPLTPIERVMLVKDLRALVANGRVPIGDALGRLAVVMNDPSPAVQAAAAGMLTWLSRDRLPEALWPNARRVVAKVIAPRARALGWQAKADDAAATLGLRRDLLDAMIEHSDDPKFLGEARALAEKWLDRTATLDPDSVEQVLRAAASRGDRKLFDRLVIALKGEKDPRRNEPIVSALASLRDPTLINAALALTLDPAFDARVTNALFTAQRHEGLPLAWEFLKAHFDDVQNRLPDEDRAELLKMIGRFCDEAHRADMEAFLKDRTAKITGGPRLVAQGLERVALCVADRAAQADGLRAFLEKQ